MKHFSEYWMSHHMFNIAREHFTIDYQLKQCEFVCMLVCDLLGLFLLLVFNTGSTKFFFWLRIEMVSLVRIKFSRFSHLLYYTWIMCKVERKCGAMCTWGPILALIQSMDQNTIVEKKGALLLHYWVVDASPVMYSSYLRGAWWRHMQWRHRLKIGFWVPPQSLTTVFGGEFRVVWGRI